MNTSHATFQAAMLSIVVSCAISSASAEVVLEDCTLDGSIGIANVEARCGWFERPENPADPDSTPIRLRVAVVPSLSPDPAPDAFTVINGGPGGSSLNMFADMSRVFTSILRDRDIIVLDQRGTGASNPLDCPELESMDLDFAIDRVRAATRKCLESLQGDPRFYTTSVAVADLEALRAELGYPQLNVYGVSYGTRVAQHYARRHPQSVRTLIIDGVAPPEIPLGPNAALNAQRTLDRLFARCAEDVNCSQAFPSLDQHLAKLRARLETDPVPLLIAHPISGKPEEIALDYTHLVLALRMLSYAPETASLLPLIIEEAEVNENYVPLASNALRIQTELSGAIRFGMHNSVVCAEDIPFVEVDTEALEATYIGPDQVLALETICELWPRGPVDDDLREPLNVDVPTLILSGEEDPITPPSYGDLADRSLPDSLHVVGAGQGHGVLSRGCIPRLMGEFVDSGDLGELDVSCVNRLTHQPFFLNLMGPSP
jgi:pimeloyl-ACP methyl ester carboxylesterase